MFILSRIMQLTISSGIRHIQRKVIWNLGSTTHSCRTCCPLERQGTQREPLQSSYMNKNPSVPKPDSRLCYRHCMGELHESISAVEEKVSRCSEGPGSSIQVAADRAR